MTRNHGRSNAASKPTSSSSAEMERVRREIGASIQDDFEAGLAAGAEGSRDIVLGWLIRLQWMLILVLAASTAGTLVQVLRYDPTIVASAVGPSGDTFPLKLREVDHKDIEAALARQSPQGSGR